jgi:hypothetical protein
MYPQSLRRRLREVLPDDSYTSSVPTLPQVGKQRSFVSSSPACSRYAVGAACVAQFHRRSSRLVLTSRRVPLKAGILRHRSCEFLLPTIESILVEFPVGGHLNYSTVTVRGFAGSQEFIKRISIRILDLCGGSAQSQGDRAQLTAP